MVKKNKKEIKIIPLEASIILFGCFWCIFIYFSLGFFALIYQTALSPTALEMFMIPIVGVVWFLMGFLTIVLASDISKGFKRLKKRKGKKKNK